MNDEQSNVIADFKNIMNISKLQHLIDVEKLVIDKLQTDILVLEDYRSNKSMPVCTISGIDTIDHLINVPVSKATLLQLLIEATKALNYATQNLRKMEDELRCKTIRTL